MADMADLADMADMTDMDAELDWSAYVDWMVGVAGSLAAVADRLAAHRGYRDDAGSVERALRRLRRRGTRDGGTWGARAIAVFGLPDAVHQRVRWLGQYHSRFTDLPASVTADLLRELGYDAAEIARLHTLGAV